MLDFNGLLRGIVPGSFFDFIRAPEACSRCLTLQRQTPGCRCMPLALHNSRSDLMATSPLNEMLRPMVTGFEISSTFRHGTYAEQVTLESELPTQKLCKLSVASAKGRVMDWNRVEGNWKQFKGQVKEKWGRLTDDDLDVINGRQDQLEGKIQERYGLAKDQAKKDVDTWFNSLP